MKRSTHLLSILFVFLSLTGSAAVFTVSNMNPSPGQYLTINNAVAAASNGDTIYVQASQFNYLSATINKRLTIIGSGHNVPNQSTLTSDLDNVTLAAGSDGTTIMGMNLYYLETGAASVDSVTITRCKFRYQIRFNHNFCNRWVIDGNVFAYTVSNIFGQNQDIDYLTIKNNVFNGYLQDLNYYGNNTNLLVTNNIFLHPNIAFSTLYYAYVYNNIFYRANPSNNTSGNDWAGNISYQCANNSFPGGTNYTNVNPQFVNFPAGGDYFSYGYNFRLQPGSPAINAGTDGLDLGVYGGYGNYEQNGVPPIPQIRSFNVTGSTTVAPGSTLNISVISTIKQ